MNQAAIAFRVTTPAEGTFEVFLTGQIGWDTDTQLRHSLDDACGRRWESSTVALNFTNVTFMDSAGLSRLLSFHHDVTSRSGRVVLVALPPRIAQMLDIVGLSNVIPVQDNATHNSEVPNV